MEHTLTAKALAHLPPYMPLQTFFLEQYYSNQYSQKQYSTSVNQSNTIGGGSSSSGMHSYPQINNNHSMQSQPNNSNTGQSVGGYSTQGSNQSYSSSTSSSQQQFSMHHHSHSQQHHIHHSQSQHLQQMHNTLSQQQSQLQSASSGVQTPQHQMLMMDIASESSEEGNSSTALQQFAHCQQLTQMKKMEQKYKTELCKNWVSKGLCQYGQKCRFAHGKDELIERLAMNKNYKTKLCTAYHKERVCQYAARCHFKHDERIATEIRYEHFYQKHICQLDDTSISQFQLGSIPKRLPIFKRLQGLDLTEEDVLMNSLEQSDFLEAYSTNNTALSQMMMLMLNNENATLLASQQQQQQQSNSNTPIYLMGYPQNESAILSNYNSLNAQQQSSIQNNFFMPSSTSSTFQSNSNNVCAKQCTQDKDLSMISNTNTAETSESISHFSLNDKFNSIPSAEKLISTNIFS